MTEAQNLGLGGADFRGYGEEEMEGGGREACAPSPPSEIFILLSIYQYIDSFKLSSYLC